MKTNSSFLLFGLFFLTSSSAYSDIRFVDDFESVRLDSSTILALPSNLDGFKWSPTNSTSIVKDEWNLKPSGGRVVWASNGVVNNFVAGKDWQSKQQSHSLRFLYSAGASMSEQRFSFGKAYPELWVSYWIRVPLNFYHPSSGSGNQKFFALWMDDYEASGNGPTIVFQYRPTGSDGSSISRFYHYTSYGSHQGEISGQEQYFIKTPEDRGRWMEIVFHFLAATDAQSKNGRVQMWRRWEDESQFTLLHDHNNLDIYPPSGGPNGWASGYLMGWANSPYSEDTEWLLDDFTISTSSLLLSDANSPAPPQLLRIVQ